MDKFDPMMQRLAAGYLGLAVLLAAAARLGAFPGTGEAFSGDPLFSHPYRVSMAAIVATLALSLGVLTAWFGRRLGSWPYGLALLVFGGMATGALLSAAPWIYYPNDQYPVTFMWLVMGAPLGFLTWAIGTLALGAGGDAQRAPR